MFVIIFHLSLNKRKYRLQILLDINDRFWMYAYCRACKDNLLSCSQLAKSAEAQPGGKIEPESREIAGFAYVALRCNSLVRLCNYTCMHVRIYRIWRLTGLVGPACRTLREIACGLLRIYNKEYETPRGGNEKRIEREKWDGTEKIEKRRLRVCVRVSHRARRLNVLVTKIRRIRGFNTHTHAHTHAYTLHRDDRCHTTDILFAYNTLIRTWRPTSLSARDLLDSRNTPVVVCVHHLTLRLVKYT